MMPCLLPIYTGETRITYESSFFFLFKVKGSFLMERESVSSHIDYVTLQQNFHLPISQVAKDLGVCATVLKKLCRQHGIPRWPHRKVRFIFNPKNQ